MDSISVEIADSLDIVTSTVSVTEKPRFAKDAIRNSLQASTTDAIFSGIFSLTTGGILLGDFLVRLDASPVAFGMLSSLPMLVNLVQPLGAYLSERTTSRFYYSLLTYGISRLLWLILVVGIGYQTQGILNSHQLVQLTLLIVFASHLVGGLGSASWLSWIGTIVPRQLRGRYFGMRNSLGNLTHLLCVPVAGLVILSCYGGAIPGYRLILAIGIICGLISLGCQYFQIDINPQVQNLTVVQLNSTDIKNISTITDLDHSDRLPLWKNSNFLIFLLYISCLMLSVSLCNPFFNFYLLENLQLPVSLIAIYSGFQVGTTMIVLIFLGKLADKIGSRPILIFIGIIAACQPLFWLGVGHSSLDLWLWLPMLHILSGFTLAATDLCTNNMQLGITPVRNKSIYLGSIAAVAGISGALGTTLGGFIAQSPQFGGLVGLFLVSSVCRLGAITPLFFLQEPKN